MKKVGLLLMLLFSYLFSFSQLMFLYADKNVPTDNPQGQPVFSYSLGAPDPWGNVHDMSLIMQYGSMSAPLLSACATGSMFDKMELRFYDNRLKKINKFTMSDVLVTSVSASGSDQGVSLLFSSIKY